METRYYICKNTETGKNKLKTEHLFCNDLWKEIKSFLFYPQDIQRGIRKVQKEVYQTQRENDFKEVRIKRVIRLARPFHSPTGYWCPYAPEKTMVSEEYLKQFGKPTRQEAIIAFEKQNRLSIICEAIPNLFY